MFRPAADDLGRVLCQDVPEVHINLGINAVFINGSHKLGFCERLPTVLCEVGTREDDLNDGVQLGVRDEVVLRQVLLDAGVLSDGPHPLEAGWLQRTPSAASAFWKY